MEILSIETDIEKISGNKVISKLEYNFAWLAVAAAGLSMLWVQSVVDPNNGTPTMLLLTLGFALFAFGIIKFFVKKRRYYCNGHPMKLIIMGNSSNLRVISKVLYSNDFSAIYSQEWELGDYVYKPSAPAVEVLGHDADELRKAILSK